MLIKGKKLLNLSVYTQSGYFLGEVDDVEVEIDGQMIINYHVSSARLLKNIWGKSLIIHRSQILSIDSEKIVVEDNVADKKKLFAKKEEIKKREAEASQGVVTSTNNKR